MSGPAVPQHFQSFTEPDGGWRIIGIEIPRQQKDFPLFGSLGKRANVKNHRIRRRTFPELGKLLQEGGSLLAAEGALVLTKIIAFDQSFAVGFRLEIHRDLSLGVLGNEERDEIGPRSRTDQVEDSR